MLADADPVSVPDCLLSDARNGAGFAARALVVDQGLVGRGPVLLVAHLHGDQQPDQSAHDAAGRDGSSSAADDERDDAADDGVHLLPATSWIEFVLRGQQSHYDCAAGGDEPDTSGARNARDDGEAGAEEGEVKKLLAF